MLSNNMSLVRTCREDSERLRKKLPRLLQNLCVFFSLPDSPLPRGPPAAGVWAARSACRLAHTAPGWWCSPGPGSLRLGPGASRRPACSCGCGTTSPFGADPRSGPRGPAGEEGWATGPPGHGHLPPQQVRRRPRGALGRPRRALERRGGVKESNVVSFRCFHKKSQNVSLNNEDLLMSKRSFFGLSGARDPLCPLGPCASTSRFSRLWVLTY